ncbi:hypothetical protein CAF53_01925 [Sphingobium sp. LB126]|uniref:oxamate carbamoyltransferase subunit AllH family protein n=1 Tax=Sphingobium sp. LB126 TaxID=1983755 RepID=UPI000C20843E|nr:DUF2877 domain-containing protein [Sphingobium sp. LB126]PJG47134.1 hypothetical protein CAF53_01925 [Sphingobium sp. LB126]
MASPVRAIHQGEAITELCAEAGQSGPLPGKILGCFTGGFYVRVEDSIFAVAGPRVSPGPIHLILDHDPPAVAGGTKVQLEPARLTFPGGNIDLTSAEAYAPRRPSVTELANLAPWMAFWASPEQHPDDLASIWGSVCAAVAEGDLETAAAVLEGRGTGLTPSGDDALSGLLLFCNWSGTPLTRLVAIASRARTTDLSWNFLRWAARGQSIEPVHILFSGSGDSLCPSSQARRAAFEQTADIVRGIGHRSGTALLAGLGLAAAVWKGRNGAPL